MTARPTTTGRCVVAPVSLEDNAPWFGDGLRPHGVRDGSWPRAL